MKKIVEDRLEDNIDSDNTTDPDNTDSGDTIPSNTVIIDSAGEEFEAPKKLVKNSTKQLIKTKRTKRSTTKPKEELGLDNTNRDLIIASILADLVTALNKLIDKSTDRDSDF